MGSRRRDCSAGLRYTRVHVPADVGLPGALRANKPRALPFCAHLTWRRRTWLRVRAGPTITCPETTAPQNGADVPGPRACLRAHAVRRGGAAPPSCRSLGGVMLAGPLLQHHAAFGTASMDQAAAHSAQAAALAGLFAHSSQAPPYHLAHLLLSGQPALWPAAQQQLAAGLSRPDAHRAPPSAPALPPPAAPLAPAAEERGFKTTNYAARHQVRGASTRRARGRAPLTLTAVERHCHCLPGSLAACVARRRAEPPRASPRASEPLLPRLCVTFWPEESVSRAAPRRRCTWLTPSCDSRPRRTSVPPGGGEAPAKPHQRSPPGAARRDARERVCKHRCARVCEHAACSPARRASRPLYPLTLRCACSLQANFCKSFCTT